MPDDQAARGQRGSPASVGRDDRRNWLREAVKTAVFSGYVYVLRPLPQCILAARNWQRIVVLLYHRVNDELRDDVSIGVHPFDEQMHYIKCNYPVIRVQQLFRGEYDRNTIH